MAKPINLYQGQAPWAFSQMGAGIAEAGAGIAKAMQTGDAQMRAGISSGINTAVNEYANYQDTKHAVTASEKAYETLRSFLPKELQFAIDAQVESMGSNTPGALNERKYFWDQTKSMLGSAVKQAYDLQRIQKEIDARGKPQVSSPVLDDIPTVEGVLKTVVDQPQTGTPQRANTSPQISGGLSGLPMNSSQGNPNLLIPTSAPAQVAAAPRTGMPPAGLPPTRKNLITGEMEFLSPDGKRYIPEPKDDLYFERNLTIRP